VKCSENRGKKHSKPSSKLRYDSPTISATRALAKVREAARLVDGDRYEVLDQVRLILDWVPYFHYWRELWQDLSYPSVNP